ncbi:MAG: hypothetical protein HZB71_01720 [Betaproteobacteria bacterium]|nr:hypothetical protein [Betaproteobacteria bacterium]
MKQHLEELLERIRTLQEEVEETYLQAREDLERQRVELAEEFQRRQRRYKIGLLRFIARARPLVALTAPVIYLGWIPFLLMDLFVSLFQTVCFPIYGIPRVRRADYLIFDREGLPYLNLLERFNCFYCTYGNGVAAYTREVAARTEQYWCPIKHQRRMAAAHDYYPKFFDHGDAEAYRRELARLRRDYEALRATTGDPG